MTQYEYLSAGTDVVFPYTSIQAISSDNQAIGGGDPNEQLVSLLNRVFTRITSLESQVANLTTQVNTLRNQLASLQVPEITEHFTLYLYTYTADTDTYPSDAAGEDNEALFTSEGEVYDKDTLKSTGWFTIAEDAANAGRDNGYETPGIWGIKLEVSKRDGKYFIYPSIEDFKYDPQLTNGDALVTTFLQKIEDVKTELTDKIDAVDEKADNAQSTIDGAVTAVTNAVNSSINTAVNDILTTKGVTTTNITKWNNFNSLKESLEAEFTGSGFVSKLETALTQRGFSAGDHDKLIAVHTKLSGITSLDTYIDNRVAEGSGISAETILNKLANNTDNLTFTDGGVSKTRTAKARLSELLFGTDGNDVITADTYMEKTGLAKFKVAIAGSENVDSTTTLRSIFKQMVGLENSSVAEVVAASSGSGGGGVNMEALELAVMSDQDNAFKRALNKWKVSGLGMSATTDTMSTWKTAAITPAYVRQMAGCVADSNDQSGYKSVDDMIPTQGQIGYIAQQAAGGNCMAGKSYNAPEQCSQSIQFTLKNT